MLSQTSDNAACLSARDERTHRGAGGIREKICEIVHQRRYSREADLKAVWAWKGPVHADIDHDGIRSVVSFGEQGDCLYCYVAARHEVARPRAEK